MLDNKYLMENDNVPIKNEIFRAELSEYQL